MWFGEWGDGGGKSEGELMGGGCVWGCGRL